MKTHPLIGVGIAAIGQPVSRRRFIKLAAGVATFTLVPGLISGFPGDMLNSQRELSLYNTHTGESLQTRYWTRGNYVRDALEEINYILRDFRAQEITEMDGRLLDLLWALKIRLGAAKPFHIISGYRSPKTNALLRKHNNGIAKKSLHMAGQAVDIRLPACPLTSLRQAAIKLRGGGVGYYPQSNFIHIDTGRVRSW